MEVLTKRAIFSMLFGTLNSGCFYWTEVKPQEIPKLNGSYRETYLTASAFSVRTLELPNGTLTKVEGASDVRLQLADGTFVEFNTPVLAEVNDDLMTLRGANRAQLSVKLRDIQKAEFSRYDGPLTVLWLLAVTVVVGGLVGLGVWAAVN
jgi:hypothetical protein